MMRDIKPVKDAEGKWRDVISGEELISIKKTKRHPTYGVKLHNEGLILIFKKEPKNFDDYLNDEKRGVIILELLQRNKSTKEIIWQLEKRKIHFDNKIRSEIEKIKEPLP